MRTPCCRGLAIIAKLVVIGGELFEIAQQHTKRTHLALAVPGTHGCIAANGLLEHCQSPFHLSIKALYEGPAADIGAGGAQLALAPTAPAGAADRFPCTP